jgi:hypothetical protein
MALVSDKVEWEEVPTKRLYVYRLRVQGGWLVYATLGGGGLTFFPDPDHEWDGGALEEA